ncbi:MAG: GDSL-type esterase/lipase family protein [Akkermansiaceae bacterium]
MRIAFCVQCLAVFAVLLLTVKPALGQWPGTKSAYHSFDLYDFQTSGLSCKVAVPDVVAEGQPWVWRARFWGHKPNVDIALLEKGFHIAYVNVVGLFGSPTAVARFDTFYEYLTTQQGLNPKAVMEGMSRGGLIVFNWSIQNPDKVYCIYADAPVCDFKSWPGGQGSGTGNTTFWPQCQAAYGFANEQEALDYEGNPIDNLAPLAAANIPLLHVVGDADTVVPVAENTGLVESRYIALGGPIEVIHKPGVGHVHGLAEPSPIVDFILGVVPLPVAFANDPITQSHAAKDLAYAGHSIAGSASVTPTDTLTYTKIAGSHSGPGADWLSMASDGALSGTPSRSEVGAHSWSVSVSDSKGDTDYATLNISVFGTEAEASGLQPLTGTGWNQDLVAESGAASAVAATTTALSTWVFYETGFPGTVAGLNASGAYSRGSAHYQMPPYDENNVILSSGTFTLTTPRTFSKLGFLVSNQGANGSSWTATVTYADSSTQVLAGTGVTWTQPSEEVVVSGHGLLKRGTGAPFTGSLSMVERQFEVDPAKSIASIQFATQSGITAIHAVSGQIAIAADLGAIWFLGDSITQSNADGDPSGSPRKLLYDLLTAGGYSFSYTGHFTANVDGLPVTGNRAATNLYHYHSGVSGSTIGANSNGRTDMTANIDSGQNFWTSGRLAVEKPDTILIMLGTNDTNLNDNVAQAPARMSSLVDQIMSQAGVGTPAIYVAQIPPNLDAADNPRVLAFNAALPDVVASQRLAGRDVSLVDQYTPINADTAGLMRDQLHTNTAGNAVLAQQWFDAIEAHNAPLDTSNYAAWQAAYFGSTSATASFAEQDPDGDGLVNLYEFAFNSDPTRDSPDSHRLEFDRDQFVVTRRKASGANLSYALEKSTNLEEESWTAVTGASESVVSTSGDFETLEIAKPEGWIDGPRNFYRVKVMLNP